MIHLSRSKKFLFLGIVCLLLAGFGERSYGFETYRFVDSACKAQTGLIVDADFESIYLLSTSGNSQKVLRKNINYILVYNTVNNPIAEVDLTGGLKEKLREFYLSDSGNSTLVGWPTHFVEELVVFYDLDGKSNLIDQDKILAIKSAGSIKSAKVKIKNSKKMSFSFGNNLPQCGADSIPGAVQPTRMISEKIKISEFLARYEKGFLNLKRFQNRTKFYAKPFLFESETRIGLALTNINYTQELPTSALPLYFQMSSGRPYSHQSLSSVGYKPVEWSPNVEPVFAVRSDLKLHFFNASIAGNLFALPAGKSFIHSYKSMYTEYFKKLDDDQMMVSPHFNYIALSGFDYRQYSLAAGVIYPIYGIYADGYFREVLASHSSIMGRFIYTTNTLRFRLLYSPTKMGSNDPDEDDIRVALSSEMQGGPPPQLEESLVESMSEFSFEGSFLRVGVDYNYSKQLKLGVDEVVLMGKYKEILFNTQRSVDYVQYITATYLKQQFGNYVALQGNFNLFYRTFKSKFGSENDKQQKTSLSGSLALEFIL